MKKCKCPSGKPKEMVVCINESNRQYKTICLACKAVVNYYTFTGDVKNPTVLKK